MYVRSLKTKGRATWLKCEQPATARDYSYAPLAVAIALGPDAWQLIVTRSLLGGKKNTQKHGQRLLQLQPQCVPLIYAAHMYTYT